jgi:hypothetical protein
MNSTIPNLKQSLWDTLVEVPKEFLQPYTSPSGFQGTSINPMFGRAKMTELFGPCGLGWGYEDDNWQTIGNYIYCRVSLWYRPFHLNPAFPYEQICYVREQGGTELPKGRDEARKQTVTDGLSRCFMALGLGAAIYAGFHDNKYNNNEAKGENAKPKASPPAPVPQPPVPPVDPSPEASYLQDAVREEAIQQFIYELVEEEPLLASCDVKMKGNSIFFAYEKGTGDDKIYVSQGFVTPPRNQNILCKRYVIPDTLIQAGQIQ